jgi:hypothetical protein
MSLAIRERLGTPVEGSKIQAYPSFEKMAGSTESILRDCGLGYRAANLLQTARILAEGRLSLDAIAKQKTSLLINFPPRLGERVQLAISIESVFSLCLLRFKPLSLILLSSSFNLVNRL